MRTFSELFVALCKGVAPVAIANVVLTSASDDVSAKLTLDTPGFSKPGNSVISPVGKGATCEAALIAAIQKAQVHCQTHSRELDYTVRVSRLFADLDARLKAVLVEPEPSKVEPKLQPAEAKPAEPAPVVAQVVHSNIKHK
jgi:hypothetical protein